VFPTGYADIRWIVTASNLSLISHKIYSFQYNDCHTARVAVFCHTFPYAQIFILEHFSAKTDKPLVTPFVNQSAEGDG